MNVTRAVLPVMRRQRSGHVVTFLARWLRGLRVLHRLLRVEVRRRRLHGGARARGRALRHPHDRRQPRLLPHRAADQGVDQLRRAAIERLRRAGRRPARVLDGPNGKQGGDPAKLAQALLTITGEEPPPRRFIAGADAIAPPSRRSPSSGRRRCLPRTFVVARAGRGGGGGLTGLRRNSSIEIDVFVWQGVDHGRTTAIPAVGRPPSAVAADERAGAQRQACRRAVRAGGPAPEPRLLPPAAAARRRGRVSARRSLADGRERAADGATRPRSPLCAAVCGSRPGAG